jgi:hypothetical protein
VKLRLKRLPQPFRRCCSQPHAGRLKEYKELETTYWPKLPAGFEIRSDTAVFSRSRRTPGSTELRMNLGLNEMGDTGESGGRADEVALSLQQEHEVRRGSL